ncbi:threonyl-tRNA synthetase editing domain-containing protein [Haloglomus irregulare]|uniref:threonyl-tRNA synthetase editing domain-containing protein n=1 Tax=Haloglomus irregulare TaxID=2234134 RepID=UPI00163D80FE|nr:threonyl-tRNA synthetase editing domain-containing protein [Haloglomus irregulare]
MRVLDIHADHCAFEAVAAPPAEDAPEPEAPTPDTEGRPPAPREGGFDDCLAVLVAVEGTDASDPQTVARRTAIHLADRAADLRLSRALIYPCPALSERAADHATTVECTRALAGALADDLTVVRAPVGWHHALALETAGHPFGATVSRFDASPAPGDARAAPDWTVLTADGDRRSLDAVALDDPTRSTCDRLTAGEAAAEFPVATGTGPTPPAGPFAARDDLGGRHLSPDGRLVHDLAVAHARARLRDHGATPVETPATFDLGASAVADLLGAVGEPWPGADAGVDGALRVSTRLGVCSLLRDATLSRADCPVRLAEAGPQRTADGGATVPTAHAVAGDRDGAWAELRAFATLTRDLLTDCGHPAVPVCRAGGDADPARLDALAAALDRPVLLARHGGGEAVDLTFRDPETDRAAVAPRVRLDPELASRADLTLADGDAPLLVECAPVGAPDDVRRSLPDPAPAWLAPTQVRFLTVEPGHRDRAAALAGRLADAGLRADVDDRPSPVGERFDRAAADRVPLVAVVGDREAEGGDLKLYDRRADTERTLSPSALVDALHERVAGFPGREPYGPRFVGEGALSDVFGEPDAANGNPTG